MNHHSAPTDFLTYDARLSADLRWALDQGGWYFEEKSELWYAFRRLTDRLNAMHVSFAVIGGLAMFEYGFIADSHTMSIYWSREKPWNEFSSRSSAMAITAPNRCN
jgi:hypothetical protein